jgi:hypothetical protein
VTDFDMAKLSSLEPAEFRQLVKSTKDDKLAEVMSGEHRGEILDAVFGRFPSVFRPDRAGSTNTVIHWVIGGAPGGGTDTYQVVIEEGTCTTSSQPDREPKLVITLGPVDFLKVVSGAGNPMMMFMTGKLKAKGDLGLAANIANLFDLPKG